MKKLSKEERIALRKYIEDELCKLERKSCEENLNKNKIEYDNDVNEINEKCKEIENVKLKLKSLDQELDELTNKLHEKFKEFNKNKNFINFKITFINNYTFCTLGYNRINHNTDFIDNKIFVDSLQNKINEDYVDNAIKELFNE